VPVTMADKRLPQVLSFSNGMSQAVARRRPCKRAEIVGAREARRDVAGPLRHSGGAPGWQRWRGRAEPDDGRRHRQKLAAVISAVGASSECLRSPTYLSDQEVVPLRRDQRSRARAHRAALPLFLFASRPEEQCVRSRRVREAGRTCRVGSKHHGFSVDCISSGTAGTCILASQKS
jgi:hypothetical protein